jgi:hypothetical protein
MIFFFFFFLVGGAQRRLRSFRSSHITPSAVIITKVPSAHKYGRTYNSVGRGSNKFKIKQFRNLAYVNGQVYVLYIKPLWKVALNETKEPQ